MIFFLDSCLILLSSSLNHYGQENSWWAWSFLTKLPFKLSKKAIMIMVWETLKIQIWSLEKVNVCLVHYKKKSSDLVQVVLSTQSGFKLDLMQPMNSWQLLKELLINGSFKTVSQSVLPILCFQGNFNKKFNKIIRISWKNISNHSTFTEMKRLLKKKLSIREVKRLSIHLTFILTVS